ncbi:MAG: AMP-binding protein [Comamonadaceae bacterium]|nr:AMP-binding protein [Comamonadaceae bacterium]
MLRAPGRGSGRPRVRAARAHARALRRGARRAEGRRAWSRRCSRPSARSRSPRASSLGDGTRAGHHRRAVPAQGRGDARRSCPTLRARAARRRRRRAADVPRARSTCDALMRRGVRRLRDRADRPPRTLALLHFTSGTTGTPKGAMHVHGAVVDALRHRPLRARPARRRRLLVHRRPGLGHRHVLRHHRAAAARRDQHRRRGRVRRRALVPHPRSEQRVTVWYTAPTAIRMLMKAGAELARAATTSRRCASSPASASRSIPRRCGGARRRFGLPIHDNWWQTETGGIMIANTPAHGHQARLDGQAAAGRRGRDRAARATTAACERRRRARRRGRAGAAAPAGRRCSAAT